MCAFFKPLKKWHAVCSTPCCGRGTPWYAIQSKTWKTLVTRKPSQTGVKPIPNDNNVTKRNCPYCGLRSLCVNGQLQCTFLGQDERAANNLLKDTLLGMAQQLLLATGAGSHVTQTHATYLHGVGVCRPKISIKKTMSLPAHTHLLWHCIIRTHMTSQAPTTIALWSFTSGRHVYACVVQGWSTIHQQYIAVLVLV